MAARPQHHVSCSTWHVARWSGEGSARPRCHLVQRSLRRRCVRIVARCDFACGRTLGILWRAALLCRLEPPGGLRRSRPSEPSSTKLTGTKTARSTALGTSRTDQGGRRKQCRSDAIDAPLGGFTRSVQLGAPSLPLVRVRREWFLM